MIGPETHSEIHSTLSHSTESLQKEEFPSNHCLSFHIRPRGQETQGRDKGHREMPEPKRPRMQTLLIIPAFLSKPRQQRSSSSHPGGQAWPHAASLSSSHTCACTHSPTHIPEHSTACPQPMPWHYQLSHPVLRLSHCLVFPPQGASYFPPQL